MADAAVVPHKTRAVPQAPRQVAQAQSPARLPGQPAAFPARRHRRPTIRLRLPSDHQPGLLPRPRRPPQRFQPPLQGPILARTAATRVKRHRTAPGPRARRHPLEQVKILLHRQAQRLQPGPQLRRRRPQPRAAPIGLIKGPHPAAPHSFLKRPIPIRHPRHHRGKSPQPFPPTRRQLPPAHQQRPRLHPV